MKNKNFRMCNYFLCALFILFLCAGNIYAEDLQTQIDEEAKIEQIEGDTAGTWQELKDWLTLNKSTGGSLKLSENIIIDENEYFSLSRDLKAMDLHIDVGEYTIKVKGKLDLSYCFNIKIKAAESDIAVFKVEEGGQLWISYVTFDLLEDRRAIEQSEGSVLSTEALDGIAESAICFADKPVAYSYIGSSLIIVPKGGKLEDFLPNTLRVNTNYKNENKIEMVPVIWDIGDKNESLSSRKRTELKAKIEVISSTCDLNFTIIFHDWPVTFADVYIKNINNYNFIHMSYLAPLKPMHLSLKYSFDESNWFTILEEETNGSGEEGLVSLEFIKENKDIVNNQKNEGVILWPEEETFLNLYLMLEDEGEILYSDVLRASMDKITAGNDIEGSRGGGTDISPNPGDGAGVGSGSANDSSSNMDSREKELKDILPENIDSYGKLPIMESFVVNSVIDKNELVDNLEEGKFLEETEIIEVVENGLSASKEIDKNVEENKSLKRVLEKESKEELQGLSGLEIESPQNKSLKASPKWQILLGVVAIAVILEMIFIVYPKFLKGLRKR